MDLKLKICRGSSIGKILVREVKSYVASQVIVGIARNHHPIRSSVAVAKYCAKKLPKDCSVLAVNNGKVAFQREASSKTNAGLRGHPVLKLEFCVSVVHAPSCIIILLVNLLQKRKKIAEMVCSMGFTSQCVRNLRQ